MHVQPLGVPVHVTVDGNLASGAEVGGGGTENPILVFSNMKYLLHLSHGYLYMHFGYLGRLSDTTNNFVGMRHDITEGAVVRLASAWLDFRGNFCVRISLFFSSPSSLCDSVMVSAQPRI